MKLSDDFDEKGNGLPMAYMAVGVSLFILAVVGVVLYMNRDSLRTRSTAPVTAQTQTEGETAALSEAGEADETATAVYKTTEELISGSKRTAADLDFWDMYTQEETVTQQETANQATQTEETDPSKDGKHTLIMGADGKEEWVQLNPYLKQNSYDYTGLVYTNGVMKYFENSEQKSFFGVDVSKYNAYIDYNKLKKAGVDFVMIRLGARGYGSGQLVMDDNFYDNIKGALDAGLHVGVYFFSQAITEQEAIEEAELVIAALADYEITYPVGFDMEYVEHDTARVEVLTREELTQMAVTFLNTVQRAGYNTVLYGTKEWLINKLDLTKLTTYDIWLAQEKDVPDYPYQFTMWQYTTQGKIDGIAGNVDFNISFVDYAEK